MTLPRTWPKPDLLQQRRIEIGLPLAPVPVPPLLVSAVTQPDLRLWPLMV